MFNCVFFSYHVDYLMAEELCNKAGAYLADILDQDESNFIKDVLKSINPKVEMSLLDEKTRRDYFDDLD